jgi:hypothetical protein
MAYQTWSVVFGEQPSAAKWNILGTNDASFNDGTGIADDAITPAKWSNPYCFRAYDSAGTTLLDNVSTQVNFGTEVYDDNSNFAANTYTAPVTGRYHINAKVVCSTIATGVSFYIQILVNNVEYTRGMQFGTGYVSNTAVIVSTDIPLTAAQTVTINAFQNSDGNEATVTGNEHTYFSGHLINRTA